MKTDSKVVLKLMDLSGKVIAVRDYGMISGAVDVVLQTDSLEAGVYVIEASIDDKIITKRLIKE